MRLNALLKIVVYILTLGHPERANKQKIGSRQSDYVILLIAIVLIGLGIYFFVARQTL